MQLLLDQKMQRGSHCTLHLEDQVHSILLLLPKKLGNRFLIGLFWTSIQKFEFWALSHP